MSEPVFHVAASPEQKQAIARFVSDLLDGKGIDVGGGTRLALSLPFDFSVNRIDDNGDRVRLTLSKRVEVDRPGVNPWLDYLDIYRSGKVFAHVRALGFSLDYPVR